LKKHKNTNQELLGFNDIWFRTIALPLIIPVLAYLICGGGIPIFSAQFGVGTCITGIFVFIYWSVDRRIILQFRKKLSAPSAAKKRLLFTSLSVLGFLLGFHFTGGLLIGFLAKLLLKDLVLIAKPGIVLAVSFLVTVACLGFYESFYVISRWQKAQLQSEKLQRENVQSQLESLRSQVNPHFLFNSLNTLASLIPEEPELAVDFVQKLSRIYRYILEIRNRELITLREEWECVESYLFLLRTRFGNNLKLEAEIPESAMALYMVPLSLQMLIENAVKHNIISSSRPLTLKVFVNKAGNLTVANPLQRKQSVTDSTGTGLENIRSRYQLISEKEIKVISGPETFTVTLPLIKVSAYEVSDH